MRNAHLRLGLLEYQRFTEKISTRIRVRVDRYVGESRKAHLLSVFGNGSDVGAITAAVHQKATFTLSFPDGASKEVSLGEHACCYKGAVSLSERKQPVRPFWPSPKTSATMRVWDELFSYDMSATKPGRRW